MQPSRIKRGVIKIRVYNKLTARERDLLAIWKAEGKSNTACAKILGRVVSTIGRELKRNSFQGRHYVAIHAQERARKRQQKVAHGKHELKNPKVYAYVTEKLREGWSPDQIAGRLKKDHVDNKEWWITAVSSTQFSRQLN